jgi:methylmalonyl-CoA mutase
MSSIIDTPQVSEDLAQPSPLRVITAASLFDGHDAAINVMRRLIQAQGCEVIHLGHNRSVAEIVRAAICEDADAIAISSYQGGHNEFFKYMIDSLKDQGADHIQVFGGGGGTITPEEIATLQAYGVNRIYHPDDGMALGLVAMIEDLVERAKVARTIRTNGRTSPKPSVWADMAGMVSAIENNKLSEEQLAQLRAEAEQRRHIPIIGLTGTGGAGKSSVTDELINRFLLAFPQMRIAVLAVDPTRRRTGGALLGDRIRMNSLRDDRVFMRSMATRRQHLATSEVVGDTLAFLRGQDFDLIILETAGIGQSDSQVVDLVDFPIYVMTSEFGAASQLEKIDMLDYAELVVLNKYDRQGSQDALRDIRKQWRRNRVAFELSDDEVPVFPTIASQFNDPGLNWMFVRLCAQLKRNLSGIGGPRCDFEPLVEASAQEPIPSPLIPSAQIRYLSEIVEQGRTERASIDHWAKLAKQVQHLYEVLKQLAPNEDWAPLKPIEYGGSGETLAALIVEHNRLLESLPNEVICALTEWPKQKASVEAPTYRYKVRGKTIEGSNYRTSLSNLDIPKIAVPQTTDWGDLVRFLFSENLPGNYPYTAGVYPYRRTQEDPIRMFAGEGTPERTNRRFHYLSQGQAAIRLSTAFDSVTLYGEDPSIRPDIYGKVGNSGVSVATLDDMKKLYSGFDLCDPQTSVSMTINGPAPILMAMFMNTAIDQQVEKYLKETGQWAKATQEISQRLGDHAPGYMGAQPNGHDGLGLGLLGISGDQLIDPQTYQRIKDDTLKVVRGTVQADILKEDQAQNTCIFSTEFALRMMGDIQQYFIDHQVRNFYSVSISGYHIAEAGANPISQLAFTLSNGFTIVEYYLARGMDIDDFAPNLSFFFSNGMDPEYSVIGRVARRIWARALKERYGANERSQMMKYHIQTSGRSLHAQEIQFNDIRTTLQALYALFDNCNSLHTNAFDEAITTPTEASVRRAVAIQMIISKELGLNFCENPWQGSYIIEQLTDLVEEAVYQEFERICERGGVLGAMDTMYQRGKIQDESMLYEHKKHDGSLPIVGVNMFLPTSEQAQEGGLVELMRSSEEEKQQQVRAVESWAIRHTHEAKQALDGLQKVAQAKGNTFEALMNAVKTCSLGQISDALYRVGGEYRRNM